MAKADYRRFYDRPGEVKTYDAKNDVVGKVSHVLYLETTIVDDDFKVPQVLDYRAKPEDLTRYRQEYEAYQKSGGKLKPLVIEVPKIGEKITIDVEAILGNKKKQA